MRECQQKGIADGQALSCSFRHWSSSEAYLLRPLKGRFTWAGQYDISITNVQSRGYPLWGQRPLSKHLLLDPQRCRKELLLTENGEVATFRSTGVGKFTSEGGVDFGGVVYFRTATSALESLNAAAVVYYFKVSGEANTIRVSGGDGGGSNSPSRKRLRGYTTGLAGIFNLELAAPSSGEQLHALSR